jgi:septal ring factor EnvC (AmiA/AmiB activator)
MYEAVRDLEEKLRVAEEEVSDRRLLLARKQEDNKRIGHSLRLKAEQSDKTEAEIADMKRTFEKLADLERERKEEAYHRHVRNKAIM